MSAGKRGTAADVAALLFAQGEFGLVRIDPSLRIIERFGRAAEGLAASQATDALPFLVGYEDVLASVGAGARPAFTLPHIRLEAGDAASGRIYTVRILAGAHHGHVDLLLQDVTEQAALEQQVMQTRNELALAQRALIEARRRAEEASSAKSAFLRLISHDLRTPLGVVIGNAEILRDEAAAGGLRDDLLPFVVDIRDSGQYLIDLIDDLLDVARGEAGVLTLDIETLSPLDPIEEALRLVRAVPGAETLAIELKSIADPPPIDGDRRRLKQVFVNLLGNAIKFTPAGGRIGVAVTANGSNVAVRVSDTGIGIAEDEQARVLEPFVRARSAGDRSGIGLGLPIARLLTERHGGSLTLDSVPGAGTTVTVILPAAATTAGSRP